MNSKAEQPLFPLTIIFTDGERQSVDNVTEAECNLEWLDTEDDDEPITYWTDLAGPVHLKVEALKILRLELKDRF